MFQGQSGNCQTTNPNPSTIPSINTATIPDNRHNTTSAPSLVKEATLFICDNCGVEYKYKTFLQVHQKRNCSAGNNVNPEQILKSAHS